VPCECKKEMTRMAAVLGATAKRTFRPVRAETCVWVQSDDDDRCVPSPRRSASRTRRLWPASVC